MSDQVPLVARNVVADVDFGLVVVKADVQLQSVVSPGAELHLARLDVEREMGDVDGAAGHEDGRRNPQHGSVAFHDHHRLALLSQSLVGTAAAKRQ